MRDDLSFCARSVLLAVLWLGWVAVPAIAQPPSATCDGNENLTGADMTPQTLSLPAPLGNNFTLTGAGCATSGGASVDHVTCFVPQNDCTLDFDCAYIPPGAATITVNLFSGSCTTSPASCIASDSGANVASLFSAALTAGTQYCVVCESSVNATNLQLDFFSDGGADCGALPVDLQGFSISRLGEAQGGVPEAGETAAGAAGSATASSR